MDLYYSVLWTTVFYSGLCCNVHCFMDMDELKSVYYGLDILSEPVVVTQNVPVGVVHVTSRYGQQYQCTFPSLNFDDKKKEEEEKLAVEMGIVEMLKPMGLNDCLFKSKDWWSYEFCFGKYIRQFHMEGGEIKGNIIYLGYYHEDFDWSNETSREERLKNRFLSSGRYHSQLYTLGTRCDLTDQMRKTEVRFMCEENSEDYIARVDESETCVYTMVVMTSKICRHPYLKPPTRRQAVPITCNPLLSELEYEGYVQEKEEERKTAEAMKAAAKEALNKEDGSKLSDLDDELAKTLEDEMSAAAKELLSKSLSQLMTGDKILSKEEFQKIHGDDESSWKKYEEEVKKKGKMDKLDSQKEEDGEVEDVQPDEDDEIISEFNEEINTIKAKFQSSQNKLSSIKRKLTIEKHWESEIENAIKEAEEELGVKVDRSLVSGLSNTLDKLVNKLHDTERELSSMDKEIGKLKPGKKIVRSKGTEEEVSAEKETGKDPDVEMKIEGLDKEEEQMVGKLEEALDKLEEEEEVAVSPQKEAGVSKVSDTDTITKQEVAETSLSDETPSASKAVVDVITTESKQEKVNDETTTDGGSEEVEVSNKKIDDSDEDLPKDVQKFLEESVRKELEKQWEETENQPLRFDSDHSFNREKAVHVIHKEAEDGKNNRFIFVFWFNSVKDESTEKEKQTALEENYSFVYRTKKDKKSDVFS